MRCPHCFAAVVAYNAMIRQARYACGATTTMLWNDFHPTLTPDPDKKEDARRMLVEWRKTRKAAGLTDQMENADPESGASGRLARDIASTRNLVPLPEAAPAKRRAHRKKAAIR